MRQHSMTFGRPIYGDRAFVAKVAPRTALTVANALRGNPLLEIASVNAVMQAYDDPAAPAPGSALGPATGLAPAIGAPGTPDTPDATVNDPLAPQQNYLSTIYAYQGWDYSRGLGTVSLVGIVDDGIDAGPGGSDNTPHPDFAGKYVRSNWQCFAVPDCDASNDEVGHGTFVAGIATADTNNGIGIASVGYTAWPMAVKVLVDGGLCIATGSTDKDASGISWAAAHGASVINTSWGCRRGNLGCDPSNPQDAIYLLKSAVDNAYASGVTLVAAAGNFNNTTPSYPAAFGQVTYDPWTYNEKLVIAVAGSQNYARDPQSSYGTWIDFVAPYEEDDGQGLLSTLPTDQQYTNCTDVTYYGRRKGTSFSAPQVSGLAILLSTLGYANDKIWSWIQAGVKDLKCDGGVPCPGYDQYTGWGLIQVGDSMQRANPSSVNMVVTPNRGGAGVQWYNMQGGHFTPNGQVDFCVAAPGSAYNCYRFPADALGVAGLGIQTAPQGPTGTWSAYMRDVTTGQTTSTYTFIVTANSQ